jgi:hypothetical protein
MTGFRVLPSLTHWLWLLILACLVTQPWRTLMVSADGDTLMHWRVGEWMLTHRQIVATDTFSHTHAGAPVISKEWLAEILFALAGRGAGLFGQALLAALVIAGAYAGLHRQLLRAGHDLLVATGLVLLALLAGNIHWLARPHVFTFLFLVLWHAELRRPSSRRLWWSLPILMLPWVNLHGGFLIGFILTGLYWMAALLERDRARLRDLTSAGLLAGVASLANPNGYRLHLHNLGFLGSDFLTGWIAEYASTNFHSIAAIGFLAWLAVLFVTLTVVRPRFSWSDALVLLAWTYFALVASRNVPLLALVAAPILAAHLPAPWSALSQRLHALTGQSRGAWLVVLLAGALVWAVPKETPLDEKVWPIQAVEYIRARPDEFAGPMFNQYKWGGYLMWFLPEHKTFIDGRTDFFGEPGIKEFDQVTRLGPNWNEPLLRRQVAWVLMPGDHPINLALGLMPARWELAYHDATAILWRRRE